MIKYDFSRIPELNESVDKCKISLDWKGVCHEIDTLGHVHNRGFLFVELPSLRLQFRFGLRLWQMQRWKVRGLRL